MTSQITQHTRPNLYPKLSAKYYWEFDPDDGNPHEWMYYIEVDEKNYHINSPGMSVEFKDGSSIRSNVTPGSLPNSKLGLIDSQLIKLIELPIEGMNFSKEEIDDFYEEYKKQL